VLRPGGRIALTTWTPEGATGEFFRTVGGYLPPPPPLAESPGLWGSEAHVEQLFEGSGIELEFERGSVDPVDYGSSEAAMEFMTTSFGPLMMARQLTEASGRWPELRQKLVTLYEQGDPSVYLVTLGRKEL
jgi:hypothetical protein